jgi:nitroreductase
MTLLSSLSWRYAAKRMNGQTVPDDKLSTILNSIRLSPSSLGLQPYTILVVSDKKVRKEIYEKACQQSQILEGSHVLVFAAHEGLGKDGIDEYISLISGERNVGEESLKGFRSAVTTFAQKKQQIGGEYLNWAARQAYIALGIGLAAAAEENVDATPMEGFDLDAMDGILRLKDAGLRSVVLMALGYRDTANDRLSGAKKVRKPAEKLFIQI